MSNIVRPPSVGFYAVAKIGGKVMVATGPHDAGLAHALVDGEVRREARDRGLSFAEFGVIRMVYPIGKPLPVFTVEQGRSKAA